MALWVTMKDKNKGYVLYAIVFAKTDEIKERGNEIMAGNDFGLSMIRLEDGKTIAVLVDPDSEAATCGIHDGTQILSWNDVGIDDAIANVHCIYSFDANRWPVAENEELFKPIFLAGKGDDFVKVRFIDNDNMEKEVTLKKRGCYKERLEKAINILLGKLSIPTEENYGNFMLDKTHGYLRINAESYQYFSDAMSFVTGTYPEVAEIFKDKIQAMKKQGMQTLVIDARNNQGGFIAADLELCKLLTDQHILISQDAMYKNGTYDVLRQLYLDGIGTYQDLDVILLVNNGCFSAGDYLVYTMKQCPNVKVAGISTSNCSCQSVGGDCFLSDSICEVCFSVNWMLDSKGDMIIDTKKDRESTLPLDIKIPLTYEGAMKMFHQEGDYELDYLLTH